MLYKKSLKIVGVLGAVILLVYILIQLTLHYHFEKKIIDDLENKVSDLSHGKYKLSINSLTINLLQRSIVIKNVALIPTNGDDTLSRHYVLRISSSILKDFSFSSYLINDKVDFKILNVENGELAILKETKTGNDTIPRKDFSLGNVNFQIPEINLINIKLGLYNNSRSTLICKTGKSNFILKDFALNTNGDKEGPSLSISSVDLDIDKIELLSADKMYSVFIEKVSSSSGDSLLRVDNIRVIPNYSKANFFKTAPDYITMSKLVCSKLQFVGIDIKRLIENKALKSSKLIAEDIMMDVYRDNNYPVRKIVKPSAQAIIRNIPFLILVDSVIINEAQLNYEELSEGESVPDKIFLSKIRALITGTSNDTNSYKPDSHLEAIISGRFMDQGILNANYSFNLNTRKEGFDCKGSFTAMPMPALTPMFKHSRHLLIKEGEIDTANFYFSAGPSAAVGKMKLIYHNLKVESLPDKSKNEKFKSFVIKNFLVKESNPDKSNDTRVSEIMAEHDPYRYFPYYSRQALMSGLVNSIIGEKKVVLLNKIMK
jgi:hypothetical protein